MIIFAPILVRDGGSLQKERVLLKAQWSGNIGAYALFAARSEGDGVQPGPCACYWLPDVDVAAGDLVVIYTKGGLDSVRPTKSGDNAHFFYWGRSAPLWSAARTPVLAEVASWTTP